MRRFLTRSPTRLVLVLALWASFHAPRWTASAQAAAGQDIIPYAGTKHPAQPTIGRDSLHLTAPVPYPNRGVLIVGGSGLTASAIWTVVDFDARTLTQVKTLTQVLPDGEAEMIVSSRQDRTLALEELNGVVMEANAVWNPSRPPAARPILTDVSCDVVLFDGAAVLSDFGFACAAEQLVKAIRALQLPPASGR